MILIDRLERLKKDAYRLEMTLKAYELAPADLQATGEPHAALKRDELKRVKTKITDLEDELGEWPTW